MTAVTEDGLLLTFGRQPRQRAFPLDSVRQIEVLRRLSRGTTVGRAAAIGGGTLDALERAYEERAGGIYGVKGSFLFATLRSHPRFKELLKKMNLD